MTQVNRAVDAGTTESDDLFRLAMVNSAIGMCLVAPGGELLSVNPALCAMLGRDESALLAATWQDITHPDDLGTDRGLVADVLAGRLQSYRLSKRYLRPDGSSVWGDLSVSCVRDSDGSVRYFVSQIVDVTEAVTARAAVAASQARHREMSQQIARQKERLELVLASSGLGLWDWNVGTGAIVVDERWAAILGFRREELEPVTVETWEGLAHPDDLAAADQAIEEHISGRVPFYDLEVRMRHRDGHWITTRDRGKIVEWTPDGDPLRMTGTHEDITEATQARSALKASQEQLEQAQRFAHVGSWTLDIATNHVTWSEELYLMQGLEPTVPPPDYTEHSRLFTPASWQELSQRTGGSPRRPESPTSWNWRWSDPTGPTGGCWHGGRRSVARWRDRRASRRGAGHHRAQERRRRVAGPGDA